MGKHIDQETKYHYVMRYLNGESSSKLGIEINGNIKRFDSIVPIWARKYEKDGFDGLESKTGKTKGKGQGSQRKNQNLIIKTWQKKS